MIYLFKILVYFLNLVYSLGSKYSEVSFWRLNAAEKK